MRLLNRSHLEMFDAVIPKITCKLAYVLRVRVQTRTKDKVFRFGVILVMVNGSDSDNQ